MLGTVVNAFAIIIGALCGICMKNRMKEQYKKTIMDGIGLSVLIIGIMGGIQSSNVILVICSIVIGTFIGELIGIEKKLEQLGNFLQSKLGGKDSNFSNAFVTASLIYCVGAMAIVGSLEAGMKHNYETLFAKSILDGISAIVFASTLGIGVAFSSVAVFCYQGSITLLATVLSTVLTKGIINEMSAVGGVLIMAIGINLLELKQIKIGNMLPAIFIPILYQFFAKYILILYQFFIGL